MPFSPFRIFSISLIVAGGVCAEAPKLRLGEVESVRPTSYQAELWLDPGKTTFNGTLTIHMQIEKPLDTLWLNQNKIKIESAQLISGGKTLKAEVRPGGEDFVGLHVDSAMAAGDALATIRYSGVVETESPNRVFRRQDGGQWYLYSQFEATDARGAFPCFDEPQFKTPWQLTLHVPAGDSAVSNTAIASEEKNEGALKTVRFKETKPLPSYLVAFSVGPFEYVEAGTVAKSKAPVRIVVPKGRSAEAKYAAEVTATILSRLEDYFGIPFPYEKSDQVSVPDFPGAMENPGMVTYGQSIILADPKSDSIGRQRGYAEVAAHELAHQWFGDLVTTAWWNDIWLNEAFATWMERKLVAEWKPEWKTRVGDVTATLSAAGNDSLLSARKIRQEIVTKGDIENAFDGITYEKGAAVIGMFESWMGAEGFRRGVQSYLRQYAFRAVTAGDFLDSLSSAGGKDVTKPFSTFLNQAGIPLLAVNLECGKAVTLQVEQKRFVPLGLTPPADQTWSVPLCVRYGTGAADSGQTQCSLVSKPVETVTLTGAKGCPTWVQANAGAHGYYFVDYSAPLRKELNGIAASLPAEERLNLIGGANALTGAGTLPAADSLALVEKLHDDPEPDVARAAIRIAERPADHLVPQELMPNYQRFLQKNFGSRAHALGWVAKAGESDEAKLLRGALLRPVATLGGDAELAGEAKALADKWLTDHKALDPNIANSVLSTAAFYGDKALFDRMLGQFRATQDDQVRQQLMAGMNGFRDPAAIDAGMQAELNGDVPAVEGIRLIFGGTDQEATRKMGFNFIKNNWATIAKRFPPGSTFDVISFLPFVGGGFCDAASLDELKAFFQPRLSEAPGAEHNLAQVSEAVHVCMAYKAAQGPSVAEFLKKY